MKVDVKTEVICFGDSHTFGRYGADFIPSLQGKLKEAKVVRDGVDGCESFNVLRRIGDRIKPSGEAPVVAVVLIGTNNLLHHCIHHVDPKCFLVKNYESSNRPTDIASCHTEAQFKSDYNQIVHQLSGYSNVKGVVCVSIPPIGECIAPPEKGDVEDYYRTKWIEYNGAIQAAVDASNTELGGNKAVYVPFGEALFSNLEKLSATADGKSNYAFEPASFSTWATDFRVFGTAMAGCMFKHKFMGYTFSALADNSRRYYLHDMVHMNERAVDILVDMVRDSIQSHFTNDGVTGK